jgi:hypothetical protein
MKLTIAVATSVQIITIGTMRLPRKRPSGGGTLYENCVAINSLTRAKIYPLRTNDPIVYLMETY